jgi:hypothetical protein
LPWLVISVHFSRWMIDPQTLANIGVRPVMRLTRQVWFKHTSSAIKIEPVPCGETRMMVQFIHETPTLIKFACQMSTALQPGSTAIVQYVVTGGRFLDDFYWRQGIPLYTRRIETELKHYGGKLHSCEATQELPDGSEISIPTAWGEQEGDLTINVVREFLRPHQAVTLRWEPADGVT